MHVTPLAIGIGLHLHEMMKRAVEILQNIWAVNGPNLESRMYNYCYKQF
jgi:hypothetical protein